MTTLDPAEVFRTSSATLGAGEGAQDAFRLPEAPGVAVSPARADGHKCARCWRVLPEVGSHKDHPDLCDRCDGAIAKVPA